MLRTSRLGLTAALLAAGANPAAWAQDSSPLTYNASYSTQTDSNLFRLPSSSTLNTSERVATSTVGVGFDTTQSLQRFEFDASLVDYKYQNFNYLSFTARNYAAAWHWALTPKLTGNLTSSLKETLNSFVDTVGLNSRNQRTDTQQRFDADFALDGPWHVVAGISQARQSNQQALVADGDYSTASADLGVRHAFASGSSIAYAAKVSNGSYFNRVVPSAGLFDDSFKQLDNDLRLHWSLGGSSTADANITHINRTHGNYGQRDFNGFNTGARFLWVLTGKSAIGAGYSSDLGAYATSNTNYTQTDRINVGPVWQMSPKITLRLNHTWAQIAYLGSPTPGLRSDRRDTTRDTALSLNWQPYRQLGLSTTVQSASRGSNIANLDYDSQQLSFSAQFNY